jgi:hypothetical protein
MEAIFERVAALDVHKAQVTACVREHCHHHPQPHLTPSAFPIRRSDTPG